MKFQDPSMHGSNVTGDKTECDAQTKERMYEQAKSNIPYFSKVGGLKRQPNFTVESQI